MEEKTIEIISKITKLSAEELKNGCDEKNLWDSLKHMEVILALEEEFDITFENEEIAENKTVNLLIQTVKNKA